MIGMGRMGFLGAIGLVVGVAGPAAAQVQPPPRPAVLVVEVEAQPISDATITAECFFATLHSASVLGPGMLSASLKNRCSSH